MKVSSPIPAWLRRRRYSAALKKQFVERARQRRGRLSETSQCDGAVALPARQVESEKQVTWEVIRSALCVAPLRSQTSADAIEPHLNFEAHPLRLIAVSSLNAAAHPQI